LITTTTTTTTTTIIIIITIIITSNYNTNSYFLVPSDSIFSYCCVIVRCSIEGRVHELYPPGYEGLSASQEGIYY
jgi:hypothetical protein